MARNGSKLLKSTTSLQALQALIRLSPDFQGLPSPWNHSETLKMTYLYLKHPQIHRKCTLEQVSSQRSTAQNGQKWVKIAKIHYFTRGAHTPKSRFSGPSKPLKSLKNTQNDLFIPQTSINTTEMHCKTTFISGKYRPKWPEMGQNC